MNKLSSWALLILGAALLAWGWDDYHSVSSKFTQLFTGAPTDQSQP